MSRIFLVFFAIGLPWLACSVHSSSPGAAHGTAVVAQTEGKESLDPLSPAPDQELRTILQAARLPELRWPNFSNRSASIKEFYDETGFRLGWIKSGRPTPQALELISILEDAERKGLDSEDYDGGRWPDRVKALQNGSATESERVKFDVALTVCGTRYISDLHLGRVDPESLHKDFDPERRHHDAGVFLREHVIAAESVSQALSAVECPYPGYQRELLALDKYLEMAKQETLDPLLEPHKTVEPGQPYEGLAKLVQRLQFLGDLPASVTVQPDSHIYSKEISEAVKRFQARHGIESDGRLERKTIAELNQPMSHRVQQLKLSLERWRWLPHNFSESPIVVNIPEFKLRAGGTSTHPDLIMAVVVGKAMRTQTPVLEEDMKYMVFWPYWIVPPSILRGEMIPKIAKDRSYIQKNNYEITTYSGETVTDGPVSDEVLAQLRAGKLTIRQKPGPKNALGLAKFIFPNDNNVYLHSTPAQTLFSRARRDFSHGCIRVEDPHALAVWVLRNNQGWDQERVGQAFAQGKQQQVNLARAIPVLILYASAVAEEDGNVLFLDDIYGHDKALAKLESQAYASQS